jgi:hypothetical protein
MLAHVATLGSCPANYLQAVNMCCKQEVRLPSQRET